MDQNARADQLKTKGFIKAMECGASGWDAKIVDAEVAQRPGVYLYVHEHGSDWGWVAMVERTEFLGMVRKARSLSADDVAGVRNGIGQISMQLRQATSEQAPDLERTLAGLLCFYAGTTETLRRVEDLRDGGHFVVIQYPDGQDGACMLRPFAIPSPLGAVLEHSEFQGMVRQVVALDSQRHPEWVRGSSAASSASARARP